MAHTLESFIERLRADGVEAGHSAAEEIRREAEQRAEQLVEDAESRAQRIVEDAEAERRKILTRAQTDLHLAARDTVAKLREALSRAVTRVLTLAVTQKLEDPDFLSRLIEQIVHQYAEADATGEGPIWVHLEKSVRLQLAGWAIKTFHSADREDGLSVELGSELSGAGFEYKVTDGTVQITPKSVVQVLSENIDPELQQIVSSVIDSRGLVGPDPEGGQKEAGDSGTPPQSSSAG
jgi:V/A-type H+-transporting ATPase subunit E